jgi:hypothetical protein
MFCYCFVLSLDACIVTITWSLLFTLVLIGLFPYILLADGEAFDFTHGHGVRV